MIHIKATTMANLVLVAKAATLSLAGIISSRMQFHDIFFLTDNKLMAHFTMDQIILILPNGISSRSHENSSMQWHQWIRRWKKSTEDSTAHSLAIRHSNLLLYHKIKWRSHAPIYVSHDSSCPTREALHSVTWDHCTSLAGWCC